MLYKIIADFLIVIHLAFIVFVLLGGLLLLKYRWTAVLHIPAVVWAILLEFKGWYCPLTGWENEFRKAADLEGYSGGFIDHYLIPLIYPVGLTTDIQTVLGVLVILVNLLIYAFVFRSMAAK